MAKNQDWYINRTNLLLSDMRPAIDKMRGIDAMYHGSWKAKWPSEGAKPDWWRDMPIAKPRTDLDAATNMFSTLAPKIKINPLRDNMDTRKRSNEVEKALAWQYWLAGNRGRDNATTKNIVFNVLAYGRAVAQVLYLPWQRKLADAVGGYNYWDVPGDFIIETHHPSVCFPVISSLGLESEVVVKEMTIQAVMSAWGKEAAGLQAWEDEGDGSVMQKVLYMDWTDRDKRLVAAFKIANDIARDPTELSQLPVGGEKIVIFDDKNDIPFLNWIDMSTGGDSYSRPEHQQRGLLDVIFDFDQWNTLNIYNSFQRAHTFKSLEKADVLVESASGELPREDTVGATPVLVGRPGDKFTPLPPAQLDRRVSELKAEDIQEMGNSTIPDIIANPSAPAGAAYATINELFTIAKSKVDPFINTAQSIIAGIDATMLRWYLHTGDPLIGYETSYNKLTGTTKNTGKRIEISSDTIPHVPVMGKEQDPDNKDLTVDVVKGKLIYLTAKLTASMPVDKVQALNGGAIMKNLGYDDETIFENLEEEDPAGIIKRRRQQELTNAALQPHLARFQAEAQIIIGKAQVDVQTYAQEKMQPQQPPQGGPPSPDMQQGPPPGEQGPSQIVPDQLSPGQQTQQALARAGAGQEVIPPNLEAMMAQAQGVDPNMGDMSPTALAPGQTPRRTERGKGRSRTKNR